MLPKRERLTRREFAALLKVGRRLHGESLSLITAKGETMKCGVVVSKKTARHATARNLLRRRVYHILGAHRAALANRHIGVLLRPKAATLPHSALERELAALIATLQ